MEGLTYEDAVWRLAYLVANECKRLSFLENNLETDEDDRLIFRRLKSAASNENDLQATLVTLMRMLHAHYGKQVILLIDEYDVPLDKAHVNGYYDQMVAFLRGIIIETKHTRSRNDMEAQCDAALKQILDREYAEPLIDDGMNEVWAYGIAFFKKKCAVKLQKIYG